MHAHPAPPSCKTETRPSGAGSRRVLDAAHRRVLDAGALTLALVGGALALVGGALALGAAALAGAPAHADQDTTRGPKNDRYLITIAAAVAAAATDDATRPQPEQGGPAAGEPQAETAPTDPEPDSFSGRLILFFVPATDRWDGVDPASGPFLRSVQPVVSVAVEGVGAGGTIVIETARLDPVMSELVSELHDLGELDGLYRVQAVLDTDFTARGHLGPGNLVSEPIEVDLASDRADEVTLTLGRRVPSPQEDPDAAPAAVDIPADAAETISWFERPSRILGAAHQRTASMRAAVVLPSGYHDLSFPRRMWPTIFVLGDFGEDQLAAARSAKGLQDPSARAAVPQAVWVFLDTASPWGYAGFAESDALGPRARALVEEFIPALEERFRLIRHPSARVLLGHGFGGRAAIDLLLAAPDTFGACFASAPDFVDFSAIGRIDLFADPTLYTARDGSDAPAVRSILGPNDDRLHLALREQMLAERAIDPDGRSGERWAARDALWSPWDAARNAPRAICDAVTGAIDPIAAEAWSRIDIARRLERDPRTIGPLLASRVHILCGSRDSFFRNEAVARLKARIDTWRASEAAERRPTPGGGSIELVDDLDDDALRQLAVLRFYRDIAAKLRDAGHAEEPSIESGSRSTRPSGPTRPLPEPRRNG